MSWPVEMWVHWLVPPDDNKKSFFSKLNNALLLISIMESMLLLIKLPICAKELINWVKLLKTKFMVPLLHFVSFKNFFDSFFVVVVLLSICACMWLFKVFVDYIAANMKVDASRWFQNASTNAKYWAQNAGQTLG